MCETCKEMKPWNPPEPLKQLTDGDESWQKIGLDFFETAGNHCLAVLDYYLLQLYRDWFTYNNDKCPYCEVAQEALCSLWQTKNDCVGWRSTAY